MKKFFKILFNSFLIIVWLFSLNAFINLCIVYFFNVITLKDIASAVLCLPVFMQAKNWLITE